jgi:hypothetical protein
LRVLELVKFGVALVRASQGVDVTVHGFPQAGPKSSSLACILPVREDLFDLGFVSHFSPVLTGPTRTLMNQTLMPARRLFSKMKIAIGTQGEPKKLHNNAQ